jgi:hypothetical protein
MRIPPGHRFEATQALRQVLTRAVVWRLLTDNPAKLGGLRPGEWLALERRDVDREARVVYVRRAFTNGRLKHTKTEASFRAVPLQAIALAALEALPRDSQSRLLFRRRAAISTFATSETATGNRRGSRLASNRCGGSMTCATRLPPSRFGPGSRPSSSRARPPRGRSVDVAALARSSGRTRKPHERRGKVRSPESDSNRRPLPYQTSTGGKADHKGTRLAHVCPAKQPRSWSGSVPGVTVCVRPDVSVLCPRKPRPPTFTRPTKADAVPSCGGGVRSARTAAPAFVHSRS